MSIADSYLPGSLALGAAIGFLSGLLGKGGSAIATPALHLLLGVPELSALASPLPATIPTTLAASWAYRDKGLVDRRALVIGAALGVPSVVIGALLSHSLGGPWLMAINALFILYLGAGLLRAAPHDDGEAYAAQGATTRALGAISLAVGFLSGLLANSGGALLTPLYIERAGMPVKRAMATSLVLAALLALPGTLTHALLGHMNWPLALAFSAASIPFSFLGARVALKTQGHRLKMMYAALMLITGAAALISVLKLKFGVL